MSNVPAAAKPLADVQGQTGPAPKGVTGAPGKRVQVLALSLPSICNRGINTVRVEQQDEHLHVHVDKRQHCAGASFKWDDDERRFLQL